MLSIIYCLGTFASLIRLRKTGFVDIDSGMVMLYSFMNSILPFFSHFHWRCFSPLVYSDTLHSLVQPTFLYLWEDLVWAYRQTNFWKLFCSCFGHNLRNILICTFHTKEEHYLKNLPRYWHDKSQHFFPFITGADRFSFS